MRSNKSRSHFPGCTLQQVTSNMSPCCWCIRCPKVSSRHDAVTCRLETDLQALEQHLESMRAVYQLNQEKLDYNCSVLGERENENSSTISQQKRRLSSFQSSLSALKVIFVFLWHLFSRMSLVFKVWFMRSDDMQRSNKD